MPHLIVDQVGIKIKTSMTWTSGYFVWNIPLISLSLHLRGRVVTKERDIKNFVKSQPPFDVHWQYLDVSDRFTRRKFWGFAVKFLTVLLISQNLARLSPVVVFYTRSVGDCLTFGVIWKQPFWIRFLDISKKHVFMVKLSQEGEIVLHDYEICFSRGSMLLPDIKRH